LFQKSLGQLGIETMVNVFGEGKKITLIDLAGIEQGKKQKGELARKIKEQINQAIKEANLVLFILDIQTGVCSADKEISKIIRKSKKKTILVLNKADNQKLINLANEKEFWQLGFGQAIPVSAANGLKIGDLLDLVVEKLALKKAKKRKEIIPKIKVAIVGRPNVGKSTLLNSILGEERVIVSPIPRTTREPQDTLFLFKKTPLLLVDTAGIRKRRKIKLKIEKIGVRKTVETIKKADIILIVFDINEKVSHQDKALIDLAIKYKKSLILVINKCDLIKNFDKKIEKYIYYYQNALPMIWWAPIIFISAKTGKNIKNLLNLILDIECKLQKKIKDKELNKVFRKIIKYKKFKKKVWEKIFLKQVGVNPPTFVLSVPKNLVRKKLISQAQVNIIKKELIKKFDLFGLSIEIKLKILK